MFEQLAQDKIKCLLEPSIGCVDLVHEEMQRIVQKCSPEVQHDLKRFPNLSEKINVVLDEMLDKRIQPTKNFISTLIEIELGYINARHPDFSEAKLMIEKKQELEDLKSNNSKLNLSKFMAKTKTDPSDPCYNVSDKYFLSNF